MSTSASDPLGYLKEMWERMGFALPGLVAPTLDTDELGKRIADLKAVEGWLKSNLNLLSMTIQALETQRATLFAIQKMGEAAQAAPKEGASSFNPFLDPVVWSMPWNMAGNMASGAAGTASSEAKSEGQHSSGARKRKRQPKG